MYRPPVLYYSCFTLTKKWMKIVFYFNECYTKIRLNKEDFFIMNISPHPIIVNFPITCNICE